MPRKFYTVLILAHARSRFRQLHLSRAFVLTVGAVATLVMAAGVFAPHLYFRVRSQASVLQAMATEVTQLRVQNEQYESALTDISARMDGFERRAGQIASALRVELPSHPAGGGLLDAQRSSVSALSGEVGALRSRGDVLDHSLERLDVALKQRISVLRATPTLVPAVGWFSHGYGWRSDPITGGQEFHQGIDIVADAGSEVRAPADGVITQATRASDYGKVVDVAHGYGYATRYGHLSEILVRPGQRVERGDVIGRVGSTGRSTGPHLHYEVFRDGHRVDPWKYLQHGS
ncbi:MAG TPA: M23 family metallopeptidase [Candidatus Polarisedimenticolaceae bacterium]|nr:M23 family metallopeptidase [Candidatus Polarisedimenticolaceae bacterium]